MLKLKVEDKARVIGNISDHAFEIGEVVTIKRLFIGGLVDHYACVNNNGDFWYLEDEELEAI